MSKLYLSVTVELIDNPETSTVFKELSTLAKNLGVNLSVSFSNHKEIIVHCGDTMFDVYTEYCL